jgi:hypothetical protein
LNKFVKRSKYNKVVGAIKAAATILIFAFSTMHYVQGVHHAHAVKSIKLILSAKRFLVIKKKSEDQN